MRLIFITITISLVLFVHAEDSMEQKEEIIVPEWVTNPSAWKKINFSDSELFKELAKISKTEEWPLWKKVGVVYSRVRFLNNEYDTLQVNRHESGNHIMFLMGSITKEIGDCSRLKKKLAESLGKPTKSYDFSRVSGKKESTASTVYSEMPNRTYHEQWDFEKTRVKMSCSVTAMNFISGSYSIEVGHISENVSLENPISLICTGKKTGKDKRQYGEFKEIFILGPTRRNLFDNNRSFLGNLNFEDEGRFSSEFKTESAQVKFKLSSDLDEFEYDYLDQKVQWNAVGKCSKW